MLADAQTSGGLLISIPGNESKKIFKELNDKTNFKSFIIGTLVKRTKSTIIIS